MDMAVGSDIHASECADWLFRARLVEVHYSAEQFNQACFSHPESYLPPHAHTPSLDFPRPSLASLIVESSPLLFRQRLRQLPKLPHLQTKYHSDI